MTDARPILDYSTIRSNSVNGLDLQEEDGQVRVLFPVTPRWVSLVPLALTVCIGGLCLFGAARSLVSVWQIQGVSFHFLEWVREGGGWLFSRAALSLSVGIACYLEYRTWTREHSVLVATKDGLLWSRLTPFGRRTSWWPVQRIAAIELRRSWGNVAVIGATGLLYIHLVDSRSRRFYLNSASRRLPRTIAERLSGVLGCPLKK